MNVSYSNTLTHKAETLIGNPSTWNEYKATSSQEMRDNDNSSVHAKTDSEKLTNLQLKYQWNNIDWNTVEIHVNRLQVRITKAVIEGKWNLLKRLSYLLTHSYYAKLLADKVVRKEVTAWAKFRNNKNAKVNWQFTTEDARIKLSRLYPT